MWRVSAYAKCAGYTIEHIFVYIVFVLLVVPFGLALEVYEDWRLRCLETLHPSEKPKP